MTDMHQSTESDVVAGRDLQGALDDLVAAGSITAAQRSEVMAAVATRGRAGALPPAAEATVSAPTAGVATPPEAPARPAAFAINRHVLRDALIEVGAYVGASLIAASAIVLVAQNWSNLTEPAQVAVLVAASVISLAIALVAATRFGGGRQALMTASQAPRRRLVGVLFAAGALAAAGAIAVVAPEDSWWMAVAASVGLVIMVVGYRIAPSWITELAMFVASFILLQTILQPLRPDVYDYVGTETSGPPPEVEAFDRWTTLALVALGLLWAGIISPRLVSRMPVLVAGLLLAMMSSLGLVEGSSHPFGLALAAALCALGFWRYLREGLWPWLVLAIAELTWFVFNLVGGANRPALAFLIAGIVLLGSSIGGLYLRRVRGHLDERGHPHAPA